MIPKITGILFVFILVVGPVYAKTDLIDIDIYLKPWRCPNKDVMGDRETFIESYKRFWKFAQIINVGVDHANTKIEKRGAETEVPKNWGRNW